MPVGDRCKTSGCSGFVGRKSAKGLCHKCYQGIMRLKHRESVLKRQRERMKDPEFRKVNNERLKVSRRKSRSLAKMECISYYSRGENRCSCCGESNMKFLTIDHVNNDGNLEKAIRRTNGDTYRWLKSKGFPEGYQILCYNCNCGRQRNEGVCPHTQQSKCGYEIPCDE